MVETKTIRSLLKQILAIGIAAYAFIVLAVFLIPHLPIANNRSFPQLLRAQMTLDHDQEVYAVNGTEKKHVIFIGSSVVERGIDDDYLDTLMSKDGLPFFSTNSASGGSFANESIVVFRALLEQGLHPDRVIYGTFLQELNADYMTHAD